MDGHRPGGRGSRVAGGEAVRAEPDRSLKNFFAVLAVALIFIYFTSRSMPPMVASHFNAAGVPNGFLPRTTYLLVMMVVVLMPPILLVIIPRISLRNPRARINVPHRDYWLAPERREQTVQIISQHTTRFAGLLVGFLCYAHWLVVYANLSSPPTLSSGWLLAGLVVFMGLTVRWAFGLMGRFRVIEEEEE
jgi:Protein of unknown function (DUF1648)